MAFFLYASFPNSRIKPRPATQSANTYQVQLSDYTLTPTLVAGPNQNRTYILLKNLSPSTAFWYVYAQVVLVNPSVVPTLGVAKQTVNFGGVLYQKQDQGLTTNWSLVAIEDVGESVDPLQTASLDQLSDPIYAAANSAVPVVPAVLIGVDEGRG